MVDLRIDPSKMRDWVHQIDSKIIESSGTSRNAFFPYRYWQSFTLPDLPFSVDISVDAEKVAGGVQLGADIATSDGEILSEFETSLLRDELAAEENALATARWIAALDQFLQENAKTVVERLRKPGVD